jgi:hypothetical protein
MSRRLKLILGGVALWYVCSLVFWAFRPITDHVMTTLDRTRTPPAATVVKVKCHSPFQSSARNSSPLPNLKPQPDGQPALAFVRTPCAQPQGDARVLFFIDTVAFLGALGGIAWFAKRAHAHAIVGQPAASARLPEPLGTTPHLP